MLKNVVDESEPTPKWGNASKIYLKHKRSRMAPGRIKKFKAEIDAENKTVTGNLPKAIESQRLNNKTLMLSGQQMGWNGIRIEQYQNLPILVKTELPALPSHWLILPLRHPGHLIQTSGDRPQESIFQKGDSLLAPAKQSSS